MFLFFEVKETKKGGEGERMIKKKFKKKKKKIDNA